VLNTYVNGSVGYVVQIERIRYKIPGKSEESLLELRATMIMRREAEGWRIAHRHADSQMTRQVPQ
jgi:ketosteroid isomerase-like protein